MSRGEYGWKRPTTLFPTAPSTTNQGKSPDFSARAWKRQREFCTHAGCERSRELSAKALIEKSTEKACSSCIETISQNTDDVPFALLYLLDEDREVARLEGASQVSKGIERVSPVAIPLGEGARSELWPIREVLDASQSRIVPRESADLIPASPAVPGSRSDHSSGYFAGAEPVGGRFDRWSEPDEKGGHRISNLFSLMADQVGTAIQNARAVEQKKRRADALTEIDRAKTEFFSNVSHEFRTPLTLMLGPLEDTLLRPDRLLPEDRERLDVAHRNSLRLLKLVNTLLDFSRIEAGRFQANYEPTDLASFTADLVSVFRSAVERAGLRLIIDCESLKEPVFIDPEMWEKVVFNLSLTLSSSRWRAKLRSLCGPAATGWRSREGIPEQASQRKNCRTCSSGSIA